MPTVDRKTREKDCRNWPHRLTLRGSRGRRTGLDLGCRRRVVRDNGFPVFRDDEDSRALRRIGGSRMPLQPFVERGLTTVEVVDLMPSSQPLGPRWTDSIPVEKTKLARGMAGTRHCANPKLSAPPLELA